MRAAEIRTRRYGAFEVHLVRGGREDEAPTVYAATRRVRDGRHRPEDVDVAQLQDTEAGAEVIHMAENGFCADGEQERLLAR